MACKKEGPSVYRQGVSTRYIELGDFLGAIFPMPYDSNLDEVGWTRLCEMVRKYIEKHEDEQTEKAEERCHFTHPGL